MGQGIAQIAAQAGSLVKLYDVQAEAVAKASKNMHQQWDKLLEKNRFTAEQVTQFKANLHSASQLSDLSDCDLVIEAIVERLDIKQSFFAELEQIVQANCCFGDQHFIPLGHGNRFCAQASCAICGLPLLQPCSIDEGGGSHRWPKNRSQDLRFADRIRQANGP